MLSRIFLFISIFFGLLTIFAVLGGYANFLGPIESIVFVLISIFGAFIFSKRAESIELSQIKWLAVIAIPLISVLILLFVSMQDGDGVYPLTCTDFMSHANNIRLTSDFGGIDWLRFTKAIEPLPFSHSYPQIFYATGSILYTAFNTIGITINAHSLLTLIAIFFTFFTGIGVFLATNKIFNDYKVAFFSTFIWQFFISNFFLLDSGFIPQIVGQFFLVSAFYLHNSKKDVNYLLALIGLVVYPHLFGLYLIYLVLYSVRKPYLQTFAKEFTYVALALLVLLPEILGLVFEILGSVYFRNNFTLIEGGTIFPNPLAFLLVGLGLFGVLYFIWKNKSLLEKNQKISTVKKIFFHPIVLLLIAAGLFELILVGSWISNLFFNFTNVSIHRLYMPAKIAFTVMIPVSMLAGFGLAILAKKGKIAIAVIAILMVFHVGYFAGFSETALSRNAFEKGYYETAHFLSLLPEGTTIGIDTTVLYVKNWGSPKFPYQSLYDNPDPFSENYCRYQEIGWDLTFPFAKQDFLDEIPGREVVDKEGNQIVFYDYFETEYLLTTPLSSRAPFGEDGEVVFSKGFYTVLKRN